MTTWVEPAATFFDNTEATNCASLSRSRARSTRIKRSSTGLRWMAPPQTMHPPSRSTTRRIASRSRSTRVSVSIVSAVPAGDVIARDDVFGIHTPAAATIDTTMGVVRFPGRPPTPCLSATTGWSHVTRSPTWTMPRVSATTSSRLIPAAAHAVRKADSSMSV